MAAINLIILIYSFTPAMATESSSAEAFLRKALEKSSSFGDDHELIDSLVFHCKRANPEDASEFIRNTIHGGCEHIIEEYLCRRSVGSHSNKADVTINHLQIYKKPDLATPRTGKKKKVIEDTSETKSVSAKSKQNQCDNDSNAVKLAKVRTEGRISQVSQIITPQHRQRVPCDCQARKHKLVTNCLCCGKIICEREGEGPCSFCGSGVRINDTSSEHLRGFMEGKSVPEYRANLLKNKLMEQDQMVNLRTTIIDDQNDWYEIDGNAWLTTEEKKELQRKIQASSVHQNRPVLLLDMAGGKVSVTTEDDKRQPDAVLYLQNKKGVQTINMMPNPDICKCPVYVATESTAKHNGYVNRRIPDSMKVTSGRVQHDDSLFEVSNFQSSTNSAISQGVFVWETDKNKNYLPFTNGNGIYDVASSSVASCLTDYPTDQCSMLDISPDICSSTGIHESVSSGVFDICMSKTHATNQEGQRIELSPSLLRQTKLNKNTKDHSVHIIMPGMIFLKNWLSNDDQVNLVRACQELGVGQGGFYRPGYGSRSKLHLWMMCLGKNWNPELQAYEDIRSNDNAQPPSIPQDFISLVKKAIKDAHNTIRKGNKLKAENVEHVLPSLQPDVCLVNFYKETGRLGLHQDRDEGKDSLQRGIPVVSFSIGDSAEFLYTKERDIDNADKIILSSGDVLIFGGASRLVFHAVARVIPLTAPGWLIKETGLRPGRLNLTFRKT